MFAQLAYAILAVAIPVLWFLAGFGLALSKNEEDSVLSISLVCLIAATVLSFIKYFWL